MKVKKCIYEMKDGSEQVSEENYDHPIAERSERAAMEAEVRDPKSHVRSFRFELRDVKEKK